MRYRLRSFFLFFLWVLVVSGASQAQVAVTQTPSPPPAPQSSPHSHQLEDETVVEFLGNLTQVITDTSKDLASHSFWVQIFISVIVALFGAAALFLQWKSEFRYEQERLRLQEQVKADREELKQWKAEISSHLERFLADNLGRQVEEALPRRVEELFAQVYSKRIEAVVSDLTKEVLMRTPEARGLLVSRFRRMVETVGANIGSGCGENVGRSVIESLSNAVQDWHTLGQLFSPDHDELQKGLLAARANPILESVVRLKRLRSRHSGNPDLVPLIDEALRQVEDLQAGMVANSGAIT